MKNIILATMAVMTMAGAASAATLSIYIPTQRVNTNQYFATMSGCELSANMTVDKLEGKGYDLISTTIFDDMTEYFMMSMSGGSATIACLDDDMFMLPIEILPGVPTPAGY